MKRLLCAGLVAVLMGSNLAVGNEKISKLAVEIIVGSVYTGVLPAVNGYLCLDSANTIASLDKLSTVNRLSAFGCLGLYGLMSQVSTAGAAITLSNSVLEHTTHLDRNLALSVIEAAF